MKQWYSEYKGNIRIHDYFNLMINQFPIITIRKIDRPHNKNKEKVISIGILGITWDIIK